MNITDAYIKLFISSSDNAHYINIIILDKFKTIFSILCNNKDRKPQSNKLIQMNVYTCMHNLQVYETIITIIKIKCKMNIP